MIFFGPPGSGKDKHSRIYEDNPYHFKTLSTGKVVREIAQYHPEGELAKLMKGGALVPDEYILNAISEFIDTHESENRILFNGAPRTLYQACRLIDILHERGFIVLTIHIDVLRSVCYDRLMRDDRQRADDGDPQRVARRLNEYHKSETCILRHLRLHSDHFVRVEGVIGGVEREPSCVASEIRQGIERKLGNSW